ncbi:MAG: DUF6122 family protein [Oceanicoccus sp.]
MTHLILHFLVPAIIAMVFFRKNWKLSLLIFLATMIVDVDHLLATPIYDPYRCSIGFHPLHGVIPIISYGIMCLLKKTRLVGVGLVIHMVLDAIDCF